MAQYFEPLIMAAIGAASKTPNHQQQMNLLDQTKTLAESALQMLYTAKEAGGNPKVSRRAMCPWCAPLHVWVPCGACGVIVQHPCQDVCLTTVFPVLAASCPHPGGSGGGRADDEGSGGGPDHHP